jgi:hypothetical protein
MTQGKPIAATTARLSPTAWGDVAETHDGSVIGLSGSLMGIFEKQSSENSHVARR